MSEFTAEELVRAAVDLGHDMQIFSRTDPYVHTFEVSVVLTLPGNTPIRRATWWVLSYLEVLGDQAASHIDTAWLNAVHDALCVAELNDEVVARARALRAERTLR